MNEQLIEVFTQKFKKNQSQSPRLIGLECEFPLVDCSGSAISYDIVRAMFQRLQTEGFDLYRDPSTSEVLYSTKACHSGQSQLTYSKNTIGTDTGYCTLEVALKPEENLFAIEEQFKKLMIPLIHHFGNHNSLILGYGIQPVTPPSQSLTANSTRYVLPLKESGNRFIDQRNGVDFHLFTITASNQCHIDVSQDEAIRVVNVLNGLSSLQIALTANSPIWLGQIDRQWKATREVFWDYGFVELQNQIGMPKCFDDIHDYIEYLCNFRPRLVQRGDQSVYILEKASFGDFIYSAQPSSGILASGEKTLVYSEAEDIIYHSGFAWFNARLAPKYGTVESRISCQQPPNDTLVVSALVLGIIENLEQAEQLLSRYSWKQWKKLRFDTLRHALQAEIAGTNIIPLVEELLRIAETGLQKRGLGEEKFLTSLHERVEAKKVPADDAINIFRQKSSLSEFINLFAFHWY